MERLGLGSADIFNLVKNRKKGIIYVEGSSFGFYGPLASAYGFEQLGQMISGLCVEQGRHQYYSPPFPPGEEPPTLLPSANCDVNTGSFGALGTLAALWRREREGGSYLVRVSLTQTALQLRDFGMYKDKKDIEKLMHAYPPLDSNDDPTSMYYALNSLLHFFIKLNDRYPKCGYQARACVLSISIHSFVLTCSPFAVRFNVQGSTTRTAGGPPSKTVPLAATWPTSVLRSNFR